MKQITKLFLFSLLVISFIGCGKNFNSNIEVAFKKYANENLKEYNGNAKIVSIQPKDTIFADTLINMGHSALLLHSKIEEETNKLVGWIKNGYSIDKMGYSNFMDMSKKIETFIEARNICSASKKWLEEVLDAARGEHGYVIHYLLKVHINNKDIQYHAYVSNKGKTRVFDEEDWDLAFSVAEWAGLNSTTRIFFNDANKQLEIAEALLRIADRYRY